MTGVPNCVSFLLNFVVFGLFWEKWVPFSNNFPEDPKKYQNQNFIPLKNTRSIPITLLCKYSPFPLPPPPLPRDDGHRLEDQDSDDILVCMHVIMESYPVYFYYKEFWSVRSLVLPAGVVSCTILYGISEISISLCQLE